ncbi:MAG: galactokinase, partial [Actinomyces sp.]
ASGVPCGIMDQLAVAAGVEGAALLIDCRDETVEPVALPAGVAVHAVHSGVPRRLAGSAYAERRAACEAAEGEIGPLRDATPADVDTLDDPVRRRRARHVVTEIARVRAAVDACRRGDVATVGALMVDSHRSLRDDFEVSIPELDALVERLLAVPGVYGARLTGAGFGGCVVALVDADVPADRVGGWRLRPSGGARLVADGEPEGDR